jgi:CheY-like chemotaxis protein/c-di-GMP-binding flagellar brake protein YcgR
MSLFSIGKEKEPSHCRDLVLAYLEDAFRIRSPIVMKEPSKQEMRVSIHSVNEESESFRLLPSGPLDLAKGTKVEFILYHDGLRLAFSTRALDVRPGMITLHLPEKLELAERRHKQRARLNPKEGATLSALQGLTEGVGINGTIENISEGGLRVRVEKAITISSEKMLVLGTTLVPPGQTFLLLKLNKIPKCPGVMETSGKVVYLGYDQSGLVMGFSFATLRQDYLTSLGGMVSGRTAPIPSAVPLKARRRQVQEEESPSVAPSQELLSPSDENEIQRITQEPPKEAILPEGTKDTAIAPSDPSDVAEPSKNPDKRSALLRMKKLSRATVVFVSTEHQGMLLERFLTRSGFGRVMVATSTIEMLECLRQPNLGVLFIDWDASSIEAIELMKLLREAYEDLPPVVLAARVVTDDLVQAAGTTGIAHVMVKPYLFNSDFTAILDKQFL